MNVTNNNWKQFAEAIATKGEPLLHSPAAAERYMSHMRDYIIQTRVPHGKFRAINNCELIELPDEDARRRYNEAEAKYIKACNDCGREAGSGPFVEFTIFRKAAEQEKAPAKADKMYHAVESEDKAAIAACCYRGTVARIVKRLVHIYKVPRSQISIIWGGDDVFNAKRLSPQDIKQLIRKMATGEAIPRKMFKVLEHQVNLEVDEQDKEGFRDLELGNQSRTARQLEIDRFQSGRSQYCIYTFAAGGTGLSLLHTDRSPFGKPVTLKPRRVFVTPTYSAQDFIQGLGRAHRTVFSLSDTYQTILFFKGTIEEHVMARVSLKLQCLTKVCAQRESWADAIYHAAVDKNKAEQDLEDDRHEIQRMNEERKQLVDGAIDDNNIDLVDNEDDEDDED